MARYRIWKSLFVSGVLLAAAATGLSAEEFNIPSGELKAALSAYSAQTGEQVMMSSEAVKGIRSSGVKGDFSPDEALSRLLSDTGFSMLRRPSGAIVIVRDRASSNDDSSLSSIQLAQAVPAKAVETVTVTSSKIGGRCSKHSDLDHRDVAGAVDSDANRWRPRSREAGAKPHFTKTNSPATASKFAASARRRFR